METILIYFLKANVALAVLYIGYKLLFWNDTCFKTRRFTLLAIYLFAFLYQIPDFSHLLTTYQSSNIAVYYSAMLKEVQVIATAPHSTDWKKIATTILLAAYLVGTAVLLLRFVTELIRVILSRRNCQKATVEGTTVSILTNDSGAYSFFHWIFINPKSYKTDTLQEVISHEKTHCREMHTIDMIVGELALIACWINPFAWLLKQEICINHEYQADQEVVKKGYDKKGYQYHLIGLEKPKFTAVKLYTNFNVLQLKKRITMLNKKRTNGFSRTKYFALLPLVGGLLLISNIDVMARIDNVKNLILTPKAQATAPTAIVASQNSEANSASVNEQPQISVKENPAQTSVSNDLKAENSDAASSNNAVDEQPNESEEIQSPQKPDKGVVFTVVEEMPEYPGGTNALLQYLVKSTQYPEKAVSEGRTGRVIVQFIVNKDGSMSDINVLRGAYPDLDAEAIRVVKAMPQKWIPGKQKGVPVRVKYTLPVQFSLH